jgi:hypothetical protein
MNKFFSVTIQRDECIIRSLKARHDILPIRLKIHQIDNFYNKRLKKGYIGFRSHLNGFLGVSYTSDAAFEELRELLKKARNTITIKIVVQAKKNLANMLP